MEYVVHPVVAVTPHPVISQSRPVETIPDSIFHAVESWRVSGSCVNINVQGGMLELPGGGKDLSMKVSAFASWKPIPGLLLVAPFPSLLKGNKKV